MVLEGEALALHHGLHGVESVEIFRNDLITHVDIVHNGSELGVLVVESVHGVHGGVEVLHVLSVHLQEGGIFHHDVSNPLILRASLPFRHPFFQLKNSNEMTGEYFSNQLVRFSHRK